MDIVDPERRSRMMSRIRGKNTAPELAVRRLAHRLGFRFRLHRRDLPGSPDLVFPGRRKVVFVHGCYWHRHPGCRLAYQPKSNIDFWQAKFARNVERDAEAVAQLERQGWSPLIIWECESRDAGTVAARLRAHLGEGTADEARRSSARHEA
ncbi:MAG: DNA mismatch endonuclease Vsr [Alphaproteobacteria bacterium]|nr:DNA mismatch endonuclease Vsr [Alphaproteobacteria bacterium]MBU1512488.1 DNA mismatch endonuclease Vsr [Alphaproteobacteria bacterium]MBU2096588.1 DNA mismatch endonuclease Vsr [Alphaproteobacteria bacterium]MBU2151594.1 DNA mismatch endonuclease Vsr [Alphaproteobacteria bacterium]MBU2307312.1 DNA mismatch endonuclease Vsr [Alphaproteobacteria bacterium]